MVSEPDVREAWRPVAVKVSLDGWLVPALYPVNYVEVKEEQRCRRPSYIRSQLPSPLAWAQDKQHIPLQHPLLNPRLTGLHVNVVS